MRSEPCRHRSDTGGAGNEGALKNEATPDKNKKEVTLAISCHRYMTSDGLCDVTGAN